MSDNESSAKRPKMEEKEEEKGAENMSIEETNKLRAKLGLAPLEINNDQKAEDGKHCCKKVKNILNQLVESFILL